MNKSLHQLKKITVPSGSRNAMQDNTAENEGEDDELLLADRIKAGEEEAFKEMFHLYYSKLCIFANGYVKSLDSSRDVVQEVFINIWQKHDEMEVRKSLKGYLYRAVRNQSLNYLKKNEQVNRLKAEIYEEQDTKERKTEQPSEPGKLTTRIWSIAEELPEKRKTVFILHRKHGLSYKEIAGVMGITLKTVENQMGRALKYIREQLGI